MVDSLPERHHFREPSAAGTRVESERVARFPDCLAFNEYEAAEFWLP
jgi:hypothetical protein